MTRLEEFVPVYQFNEVHRIRIRAPKIRIHRSIKEVTAGEITLFRALSWIRRFGRTGPESILNAPSHEPRVHATDTAARRAFARYWTVIRPGSGFIRRMWLRAIKRRAESPGRLGRT